jgi:multidrug efflux pump subunit AcrB
MCFWLLPDGVAGAAAEDASRETIFQRLYRPFLSLSIAQPAIVATAIFAVVAASVIGLGRVTPRLMPNSDRAQFVVYVDLPAGADVRETSRVAQRLADWLTDAEANPEIESNIVYVGAGGPRFFLALSPPDPASHVIFGVVNLASPSDVEPLMRRASEFAARELPEGRFRAEKLFLGSTPPGTVEIRIFGPEIEGLERHAVEVAEAFRGVPGTRYIRSDWENPVVKLTVNVDQGRARLAGVTSEEVARSLAGLFDGYEVTDYREGNAILPVTIRSQEAFRDDLDDLRAFTVYSASRRERVPLVQIADIRGVIEPSQIRRVDQRRAVTVKALNPDLQAAELYAAIGPTLEALDLGDRYELGLDGELRASQEANSALYAYFPHCLMGIVFLLILQFNSFRRPAIVFLTIPLVLVGATLGLLALNGFLDFVATLGFFSLAGVIVNNGIVLIDRIDQERGAGASTPDAVRTASLARVRPIVMTALTTILGLVPLMLFGGEFWYSMSIVMVFGLAVGTLLSLLLVPSLYLLFFRRQDARTEGPRAGAAAGG